MARPKNDQSESVVETDLNPQTANSGTTDVIVQETVKPNAKYVYEMAKVIYPILIEKHTATPANPLSNEILTIYANTAVSAGELLDVIANQRFDKY